GGGVEGVPSGVRGLFGELPFNDSQRAVEEIRSRAGRLACVVVEPLLVAEPNREWLETLRRETERAGAVLVFDEIKTGFRIAVGGATERYGNDAGLRPDLAVYGKAMANGFPLAVVGGRKPLMDLVSRTWISSTLATESVSLAAAKATLEAFDQERVCQHLHRAGTRLLHGLHRLQRDHADLVTGVCGVAEMCFLSFANEEVSRRVAVECARRGVLFKRTAYNFVSLAHDDATLDATLGTLDEGLRAATSA
ncbi:MAG: aminotransferase class III-fold pyridoxal phosphate-dependent enzyme, partial [Gemmatimonadales bacterium]